MVKGIIFDLDGTLWDSRESVAEAWNRAIEEHSSLGVRVNADILGKLFGKPMDVIFGQLFPQETLEERKRLSEKCCEYENERILTHPGVLYQDVEETLKVLSSQYPLYIVSNCQNGYIEAFLEVTGFGGYFQDFTCPGATGKMKGENIRIIMERNGLEEAVYVGDTQGDADASKEAGVPFIFAAYGLGETDDYWKKIEGFGELANCIKEK